MPLILSLVKRGALLRRLWSLFRSLSCLISFVSQPHNPDSYLSWGTRARLFFLTIVLVIHHSDVRHVIVFVSIQQLLHQLTRVARTRPKRRNVKYPCRTCG